MTTTFTVKEDTRAVYEDNGALVKVLGEILHKGSLFVRHFDSQTHILIGISTAIFAFSVSKATGSAHTITYLILSLFSGVTAIVGLYAIHPPRFMRKRGQNESLMYNRKICSFDSPTAYAESLTEMLIDREKLVEEYATEIFNLYKYYYTPKRKIFNFARKLLIIGLVLSMLVFMAEVTI